VVFSSVCWRTQNWCEVEVELPGWEAEPGLSYEGEEIEVQVLEAERDEEGRLRWAKLGFIADLPPLGYRAYRLVERTRALIQALVCEENEVSNAFFRLRVNPENGIVEIFDKRGKMVLRGNELNIENDIGDLYYHRHMFFELIKNDSGEGIYYGTFKPDSFRVERGPLKLKLVVEEGYYCLRWPYRLFDKFETKLYKHRVLDVIKEIIVYRDLPRIEFVTRVNSRYPNTRLRVRFDTFKERMQYYRETQFGVVREPTELFASLERTGTAAGIPSFQSWCCYGDGTRGVIFMNRGLPATEIEGSNVYLTLLRSVGILSADGEAGPLIPTPDALELNRDYTFEYAVEAYSGDCADAEVYERGRAFHRSVVAVQADRTGDMPQELSFLSLSVDNLILSAFKKADDGDAVILRFFEAKGEQTTCECTFFRRVKRVVLTDLLENEEGELRTEGNKVTVMFRPFEILTLKVEL